MYIIPLLNISYNHYQISSGARVSLFNVRLARAPLESGLDKILKGDL